MSEISFLQYELIEFDGIWLTHAEQYRWLQVDYQIGVFISRSSVNLIAINKIWIMSVLQVMIWKKKVKRKNYIGHSETQYAKPIVLLQFINVIILLFETLYYYIPNIWIVFAIVLWEGLLGGGAYVNTFYRMSTEVMRPLLFPLS